MQNSRISKRSLISYGTNTLDLFNKHNTQDSNISTFKFIMRNFIRFINGRSHMNGHKKSSNLHAQTYFLVCRKQILKVSKPEVLDILEIWHSLSADGYNDGSMNQNSISNIPEQ